MYSYISYILLTILFIVLFVIAYIKIKYKFWSIQPVFHVYNFNYMIFPPGIIDPNLPSKNKYTNFENIKTYVFDDLSEIKKNRLVNFIRLHYLQNNQNTFLPSYENIFPYFNFHNDKSFISLYTEKNLAINLKKGTTVNDPRIIGIMTSRPLQVMINNDTKNKDTMFRAYYVDYLCVDKMKRKKGIAPQMIQTHHYNQRHANKNIVVSLFKREDELTGIVPLCVYKTFGFPVLTWHKPYPINAMYGIVEISSSNFDLLYNFIKENNKCFDVLIISEPSNIIELIKTKNIFINIIVYNNNVICAYFFRKTRTFIEENIEVLNCFASINAFDNKDIFIQGFKISFWNISEKNNFGFASIENISHNDIIIDNISIKTKPTIISPTAYFFYNFAYPTFKANKTFIIN